MTNRAFIPTVHRACRAQWQSAAQLLSNKKKQRKKKAHTPQPPNPIRNARLLAHQVGTADMRKGINCTTDIPKSQGWGKKSCVYLPCLRSTTTFDLLGPTASSYFQKHVLFFLFLKLTHKITAAWGNIMYVCCCPHQHTSYFAKVLPWRLCFLSQ